MVWFVICTLLGLAYLGLAPLQMPMRDRLRVAAVALLGGLLVLALTSPASAQPVDKEAVRAELRKRGYSCRDLQQASKATLFLWAMKEQPSAEERRKITVTCNLK